LFFIFKFIKKLFVLVKINAIQNNLAFLFELIYAKNKILSKKKI